MTTTSLRVYRKAASLGGDIYHFHDPELILAGLLLRLQGKTVIYDVHEDLPKDIWHKRWLHLSERAKRALAWVCDHAERLAAQRFSAIVTADESIASRFTGLVERVKVIGNYPLSQSFSDGSSDHSPDCAGRYASGPAVCFGGISGNRVTDKIVQAMERLLPGSGRELILGGACQSEELLAEIQQMAGFARVKYVGIIPFEEMVHIMKGASMALVLYGPGPAHVAVKSNRLFESMAAGLPVIASHVPQWRTFINRIGCGVTVDPLDPEAIAAAMEWLLTHPAEAQAMGARGRTAVAQHYSWENESGKLLELYADLEIVPR